MSASTVNNSEASKNAAGVVLATLSATVGALVILIGLEIFEYLLAATLTEFGSLAARLLVGTLAAAGFALFAFKRHDLLRKRAREEETARKRLEDQLLGSHKLEAVGRLAGGIAHDFNNMLTAINGYSDITLRQLPADDPLRANIEQIWNAGKRSAELTRQLLAFSRKQMMQKQDLDLYKVVLDLKPALENLAGGNINVEIVCEGPLDLVSADPEQISQAIMNLAENAVDAMHAGGGRLLIETANIRLDEAYAENHVGSRPGNYVMIAITDFGPGISPEIQKHIFEPFFTTKEMGKGSGLGLATVYGTVKQSDGYITVSSGAETGTTFNFYLPIIERERSHEVNIESQASSYFGTETILLVENEPSVRDLTKTVLRSFGYEVIEAVDVDDAVRISTDTAQRIDLLLTDVKMPKLTGPELAKAIAAVRPGIKTLFMSGFTEDTIFHQDVAEANRNFIAKPFTLEELTATARKILDA